MGRKLHVVVPFRIDIVDNGGRVGHSCIGLLDSPREQEVTHAIQSD